MFTTLIAIAGTLAGGLLSGLLASRQARTALRGAEGVSRRQAAVEAAADLVSATAAHRAAMWHRESLRLAGRDWTEARTATRATRAAISAPSVRVAILAPALAPAATAAAEATYALRDAGTIEALEAARTESIAADQTLIATAGRLLGI